MMSQLFSEAAAAAPAAARVTVSLKTIVNSAPSSGPDMRILTLPTEGKPCYVGRASQNASKNLRPAIDNALYDCPVMSRGHATLSAPQGPYGPIILEDTESMHGVFVNGKPITRSEISTSDVVRFGGQVTRSEGGVPFYASHLPSLTSAAAIHDGVEVYVARISREPAPFIPNSSRTVRPTPSFRVPDTDSDTSGSDEPSSKPATSGTLSFTSRFVPQGTSARNPLVLGDDDDDRRQEPGRSAHSVIEIENDHGIEDNIDDDIEDGICNELFDCDSEGESEDYPDDPDDIQDDDEGHSLNEDHDEYHDDDQDGRSFSVDPYTDELDWDNKLDDQSYESEAEALDTQVDSHQTRPEDIPVMPSQSLADAEPILICPSGVPAEPAVDRTSTVDTSKEVQKEDSVVGDDLSHQDKQPIAPKEEVAPEITDVMQEDGARTHTATEMFHKVEPSSGDKRKRDEDDDGHEEPAQLSTGRKLLKLRFGKHHKTTLKQMLTKSDARPSKRVRTRKEMALCTVAGAVGGMAAMLGFLMTPQAEQLMAHWPLE